jgi:hypothetical protein
MEAANDAPAQPPQSVEDISAEETEDTGGQAQP